jgi:hypothetical protein
MDFINPYPVYSSQGFANVAEQAVLKEFPVLSFQSNFVVTDQYSSGVSHLSASLL